MDVLERLRLRVTDPGQPEPDEDVLKECLEEARDAIMARRFPYRTWPDELEPQYVEKQIRIAISLYNRIGDEGETGHTENGVTRTYDESWIPKQLLADIIPYCGVIS